MSIVFIAAELDYMTLEDPLISNNSRYLLLNPCVSQAMDLNI